MFFSVWTDLKGYFFLKTGVLHVSEKLHYFKIHQEYLLMKEKTPTGARSGRRPGLTNHILKVVKILYGMLGQRDRAGWVSRILYLYSRLITSNGFFSVGPALIKCYVRSHIDRPAVVTFDHQNIYQPK